MTDISDDAVRAFMAAEVPGILDEHLDLAVKSVDGDKVRAGLAAALPYLLEQDRQNVAEEIRAQLVCCDIYELRHGDHEFWRHPKLGDHDICYWAEASARIVEDFPPVSSDAPVPPKE